LEELPNKTDQVMSVYKVALANLAMWTRDQYFPHTYAHATWQRLVPFFRLPGWVTWEETTVRVKLRPFNDHQLTRDLQTLCERVQAQAPRTPMVGGSSAQWLHRRHTIQNCISGGEG
jgi:hypothetical protein